MTNLVEVAVAQRALPTVELQEAIEEVSVLRADNAISAQRLADLMHVLAKIEEAAEAERKDMKAPILAAGRKIDSYWKPIIDSAHNAREQARRKLEAEAERARQQQAALEMKAREETRRQQEALAREAGEREAQGRSNAQRLRSEAAQAAKAGNQTLADELIRRADQEELAGAQDAQTMLERVQELAPVAEAAQPELDGVAEYDEFSVDFVDLKATVDACAAGSAPLQALTWDEAFVNKMARALKYEFKLAGCIVRPRKRMRRK